MKVFIDTTRLTSQMETAGDNPAVEAEVTGAAGLQGFPLWLSVDGSQHVKTYFYHSWKDVYIDSLSLFLGFEQGTRVLTPSHVSQIQMFQMFFSFTWMPPGVGA